MNKKVLLYIEENLIKPIGGQSGYIYNLKSEIDKRKLSNIVVINNHNSVRNKLKNIKNGKFKDILFIFGRTVNYFKVLYGRKHYSKVDLSEYDIVHFHNVKDMYEAKDSLIDYKGIVMLTSHSPKPFTLEIYEEMLTEFERKVFKRMYKKLINIENYAFNRADYIVFPCPEAEEPYYNNWGEYKKIKEKNSNKYRYLLTGTKECNAKQTKEEIKNKYNIPKEAFIISYVGRHNTTKGYDMLKEIGEEILKNNKNVYFLIAGKEEPLKGLNNKRWIEVGWTNDPHSIIAASDVFILPNKETYFDLVMLEVLSLGKIVVASNTGGNRYFSKTNSNGILLYDTKEEAIDNIKKIIESDIEYRNTLEKENKKLFNDNFNNKVFCDKYIELLNEVYNKSKGE